MNVHLDQSLLLLLVQLRVFELRLPVRLGVCLGRRLFEGRFLRLGCLLLLGCRIFRCLNARLRCCVSVLALPVRNDTAAILRRMQPRWRRYRGGLLLVPLR